MEDTRQDKVKRRRREEIMRKREDRKERERHGKCLGKAAQRVNRAENGHCGGTTKMNALYIIHQYISKL